MSRFYTDWTIKSDRLLGAMKAAEGVASLRYTRSLANDLRDEQEQVGIAGLLAGGGQHRMRLSAVMGLVIEEMRHQQPLLGGYLAIGGAAKPSQVVGKPCVIDFGRPRKYRRLPSRARHGAEQNPRSCQRSA